MYRRTKAGEVSSPGPAVGREAKTNRSPLAPLGGVQRTSVHGSTTSGTLSPPKIIGAFLFILFVSMMILNQISPSTVHDAEQNLYNAELVVQHEVEGFFGGGVHELQVPPVPHDNGGRAKSHEASASMLKQESSWVDGEKKLKKKLKELAARQAEGKDLGVPVLTRWLGDDIPAWAGEGVNVEEWQKKVEARYAEMREEENRWREKMAQFMDTK